MSVSIEQAKGAVIRTVLGLDRLCQHVCPARPVAVGLLDGVVHTIHPVFSHATIVQRRAADDRAHATAMASLLTGSMAAADSDVQVISLGTLPDPGCASDRYDTTQVQRICDDVETACRLRVDLIVLGFEFVQTSATVAARIASAMDLALRAHIPVFAPAGNHGRVAVHPLLTHPAVVPVGMTTLSGVLDQTSAWGPVIASRGLRAPGVDIPVALPPDQFGRASGTSFASALAAASCAALLARLPSHTAEAACVAMRRSCSGSRPYLAGTRTVPPAFDAWSTYRSLMPSRR